MPGRPNREDFDYWYDYDREDRMEDKVKIEKAHHEVTPMILTSPDDRFNELSVKNCTLRFADDFLWLESGIFQHSLRITAQERVATVTFLTETNRKLAQEGGQEYHAKISENLEIYVADCEPEEDHFNLFLDHHDARFSISMNLSDLPKLIAFFVRGAKDALDDLVLRFYWWIENGRSGI